MTVVDFRTVTSSNMLTTANMGKAKKLDRLRAIDERENLKDLAKRKKINFSASVKTRLGIQIRI